MEASLPLLLDKNFKHTDTIEMKKLIAAFLVCFLIAGVTQAQKFAYVDTQFILEQMDEYQTAQQEIDALSQRWQKELEEMHTRIEQLYRDYQAEEVLLSEDVRKQRQEAIYAEERKAKEYKKQKFGYEGELYKVQDDKIRPVQDKIFAAVEAMAKERRLDVIFDKSGNSGMLYTNAVFDKTDEVMTRLGIK